MTVMQRRVLASMAAVVLVLLGAATWFELRPSTTIDASSDPAGTEGGAGDTGGDAELAAATSTTMPTTTTTTVPVPPPPPPLPEGSGEGRRVVFSVGGQRMWWVDESGTAIRTSLVSGREATPELGTFSVYSRTEHATGLDGSKMDNFVRFTKGPNGWAIGFHGIPTMDGVPVQTEEQLGQPLSHGCIRQSAEDAAFTWEFLPVGATVVVVA